VFIGLFYDIWLSFLCPNMCLVGILQVILFLSPSLSSRSLSHLVQVTKTRASSNSRAFSPLSPWSHPRSLPCVGLVHYQNEGDIYWGDSDRCPQLCHTFVFWVGLCPNYKLCDNKHHQLHHINVHLIHWYCHVNLNKLIQKHHWEPIKQ